VLRNATREPNPPLPAEQADPQRFGEIVLSHPPELLSRLTELVGIADALRICRHDNAEPPTIVRLFASQSAAALAGEGVTVTPHERPGMFVVEGAKQSILAAWAKAGVAQVQDPTAAVVVDACDVSNGQTVLDRCAGLGTKTLQLRERTGDTGHVYAVDASALRCEGLRQLLAVRKIGNVHVFHGSMLSKLGKQLPPMFDRVLVDAPCSNSGVLARRPEARYSQDERILASLETLQRSILKDTAPRVAAGGLMVYSTCSIWPEENEAMVASFLREHPAFELLKERSTLTSMGDEPSKYHDGGYFAVLSKRDGI
jgi:16S rRNA (cytosine967-C5)-methyltransferase